MVEKVGKAFQDDGKIGKQFQDGKAAKTAQEAPTGATDKHGEVGKEFKSDGAVVSMLQGCCCPYGDFPSHEGVKPCRSQANSIWHVQGGRVEKAAEKAEKKGKDMKQEG